MLRIDDVVMSLVQVRHGGQSQSEPGTKSKYEDVQPWLRCWNHRNPCGVERHLCRHVHTI